MVICGFVLAIAMFLLWPSEPPPFITLVTLITAAAGYAAARYFEAQRVQRIGQIFLAMMLGVSWVQARTHWEARQTGQAVFGETQSAALLNGTKRKRAAVAGIFDCKMHKGASFGCGSMASRRIWRAPNPAAPLH